MTAWAPSLIGRTGDQPYLWLVATHLKQREGGRTVSVAAIIAVAVDREGKREIMGLHIGPSEAETFWSTFLKSLVRRGLRGTKLLISDAHERLKAAIRCVMSAPWQRYRVHWMRKALAYVSKGQLSMASASLRQAFGQDSPEKAQVIWRAAADRMRQRWPKLGVFMDDSKHDVLAYMGFPDQHRAKLHSTNALERLNKELKRRTDTVSIFPSEAVEVHDDQGVAGTDVAQQPDQHRPAAVGARGVLFQDGDAAGGAQLAADAATPRSRTVSCQAALLAGGGPTS